MTKEEIKEEVKKVIIPLCFNEATLDWEVVGSPRVLVEVIKEIISEDETLREKMTEGAGELHDIQVSWTSHGGDPIVSVYYKVKPEVREVNRDELDVFVHKCKKNDYDFVTMSIDDIDLRPKKVAMLVKARFYELEFPEIVYSEGQVIARCLKDASKKLFNNNKRIYNELYHKAFFGESGIISKMM